MTLAVKGVATFREIIYVTYIYIRIHIDYNDMY